MNENPASINYNTLNIYLLHLEIQQYHQDLSRGFLIQQMDENKIIKLTTVKSLTSVKNMDFIEPSMLTKQLTI